MENIIKINNDSISTYLVEPKDFSELIIFLHGGGKSLGKDRFKEWQDSLGKEDIGSLSFDCSGVGKSSGNLTKQSLQERINQTTHIIKSIKEKYSTLDLILFGVSMGGYVALGLINQLPNIFDKLILHAPAAYSSVAHELPFDFSFTRELRKPESWEDSRSFQWLEDFNKNILFITNENEEIIPKGIIEKYKFIGQNKMDFKSVCIPGASHNIWGNSVETLSTEKESILNY